MRTSSGARGSWVPVAGCALAMLGFVHTAAAQDIDDILDICMSCHGEPGRPPGRGVPPIAGEPAARIAAELVLFRSGARENPQMARAKRLTDAEIEAIAAYFAGLAPNRP